MTQFKDLDSVLHSQLRLAIVSLLMGVEEAEFSWLREQTSSTSGNLSIQISKLKEAGYIDVTKKFRGNYPLTLSRITPLGKKKFAEYVTSLNEYLNPGK
jgi:DNA-binding transcriptional ArsR family regulator